MMVLTRESLGGDDGDGDFLEVEGGLEEGCAGNVDSRKSCLLGGVSVKMWWYHVMLYVMRGLFEL